MRQSAVLLTAASRLTGPLMAGACRNVCALTLNAARWPPRGLKFTVWPGDEVVIFLGVQGIAKESAGTTLRYRAR